ncbi:3d449f31-a0e1-495a-8fa3-3b93fd50db86 [Sclerotinia trifoliorum]|uniref:3d449f31-a0e1-495a-8fa3-3b93fd50db86 n=1 Tax=Sclerotinia trifoliorum TaxID=28548 RepID=A0A8H2ZQM3_9HELO|nr:3d449f31-a0e1-495a-8fa3-3b93fd50db86 [Sclerotinia trifoliorum]
MPSCRTLFIISLWAIQVFGLKQLPKRTASISYNETSTSSDRATITSSAVSSECCYLSSFEVGQVLWYSESINIIVATVSTVVYKYDNTAITETLTISTNSTVPSRPITRSSINGLPTTIIGTGLGVYQAETTFIHGTAFTDPYGTVYESPTPVWIYTDVIYATALPKLTQSAYVCPNPNDVKSSSGKEISPYPSGFFLADNDPNYGWNSTGAFSTTLPTQLRDWMASYAAADTENTPTNLGKCGLGAGRGVPTAYVPYNEITATITTTSTMYGNFGIGGVSSPANRSTQIASSTSTATTPIKTITSQSTRSTTRTSIITITKMADISRTSQTPSVQTIVATVKAALINTITPAASTTISYVSQTSSTPSQTSDYVIVNSELITQNESVIATGTGSSVSTAMVKGGSLPKIVLVMDWASTSTSGGVGGSTQTGTGTAQALTDTTVPGVARNSSNSGGSVGRKADIGILCVGSVVLAGLAGVWGV